ncbi:G-protein coupled receptor Mth2-like [Homarus americanus]|uniref:G-protein coupled receptor Mth2-like 2 n=1 Tax=Homarus americanus TaxID=6706 RepID=A0A8J5JX78_HOMAM|nr:G-protein coupled receptor Mth2-like [Homarus americanus]XP_042232663.1 G-protein coupled receptor Mth2-like [Homarus americanus]KAG7163135.1 G-protein coupled receptor Mth2-like 2 [Homarus americanus]
MNLRYCTWKRLEVVTTVILVTVWGVSSNFTQSLTDSQVTESLLTNFTLKKCQCEVDHVLDESTCIKRKTVVILWDTINNEPLIFNTSMFENIVVAEPQCSGSLIRVVLNDSTFRFFFLPSGELQWEGEQSFQDYCIENYLHDGHMGWEAHVCLPAPPVPRCCPPGYALAHDDSCVAYSGNFAPPIDFNNMPVQWAAAEGDVQNVTCHGISVVRHLNLNTREGILAYNSERAILEWKSSTKPTTYNREYEYCVGMNIDINVQQYVAKFCYLDPSLEHQVKCNNSNCVRKCCPQGQLLLGMTCVNSYSEEEIWQLPISASQNNTLVLAPAENWTVVAGFPFCESFFDLESDVKSYDEFYLLPNGSLHIPHFEDSYPPTNYCLDLYLEPGPNYTLVNQVILCAPGEMEPPCHWKNILIGVLLGISCLFLVATLGVYLGVAEIRDRTYGRCLISMVTAMLASYLTLIINNQVQASSDAECITMAFIGHVSTLATFFWLNVMCYDMWSTLRSSQQKHHSKKVFLLYSIYAWGGPLVVGVVALVIDSLQLKNAIRPHYTDGTCWFYGTAEYWLYLAGIIFILVVINLFFFVHVAVTLAGDFKKTRRTFNTTTSHSSNAPKTKLQAWLYIKLFIVMGIVWIAETISGAHQRNSCTYWVFFDIINALQGVFIFLVTVCNKDNKKKIRDTWNPRLQSVQKTLSSMRAHSSTMRTNTSTRVNDLSIGASESSRKTSVTSLPRKFSIVSNIFHPASNRDKAATELSDTSETPNKSKESTANRKISTTSNLETIPMETMDE